jgi:hypothetical protein
MRAALYPRRFRTPPLHHQPPPPTPTAAASTTTANTNTAAVATITTTTIRITTTTVSHTHCSWRVDQQQRIVHTAASAHVLAPINHHVQIGSDTNHPDCRSPVLPHEERLQHNRRARVSESLPCLGWSFFASAFHVCGFACSADTVMPHGAHNSSLSLLPSGSKWWR